MSCYKIEKLKKITNSLFCFGNSNVKFQCKTSISINYEIKKQICVAVHYTVLVLSEYR